MPVAKFSKRSALVVITILCVAALILTILACTLPYWYIQDDGINPRGTAGLWQYCRKFVAASGTTAEECYNWSILTDATCKAYLIGAQALSLAGIGLLVLTLALAGVSMRLEWAGLFLALLAFLAFGATLVCWCLWMVFAEKTCTTTSNIVFGPLNWYSASFILQCIASGLTLILLCFAFALQAIHVREKAFAEKQEADEPKPLLPMAPLPPPTTVGVQDTARAAKPVDLPPQPLPPPPPPAVTAPPAEPPAPAPAPAPAPTRRPARRLPSVSSTEGDGYASESPASPASRRLSAPMGPVLLPPPGLWGGLPPPPPLQPADPWAPRVTYYYHIPTPAPAPVFSPFPPTLAQPAPFPIIPPSAPFAPHSVDPLPWPPPPMFGRL
eukprot:EG_transcript_10742